MDTSKLIQTFAWVAVALIMTAALTRGNATTAVSPAMAVNLAELTIDRATGNRVYHGLPYSGLALGYQPTGEIAEAEQFLQGRRHGYLKRWFTNGQLAFESYYQKGRREGATTSWWSNGNQRSQSYYVNDQAEGVAWKWYRGGEKFKKYNFESGQPVGLQQGWRLNGKLFSNFEYRNGRAFGLRNANMCVELENENLSNAF